ncbi:TIGR02646 family protein [Collimonas sp. OK242]|uniref:HNH endonuclease n=1 Tax=Collimonas sp. OK242 TaxID=1798195 RepID=UPI000896D5E8|nr:HNH endonuclease [Collimonas sp. OK242]SDY80861.1 TIGR02646 family protein [Collimonas sp. OK242]
MAMIDYPIRYSATTKAIIEAKQKDAEFQHQNWSDDDLTSVRHDIRHYYREIQRGTCAYCRGPLSLATAANCHVEHIAPKSLYKEHIFQPKNLCAICADCNTIKRAQEVIADVPDTVDSPQYRRTYPRSSSAFKIVHPHFDVWEEHILQFGKAYVDRSKKGCFTISACKLNRFFHNNGWEEEYMNDQKINQLMNDYLQSDSKVKAARILTQLRGLLFAL